MSMKSLCLMKDAKLSYTKNFYDLNSVSSLSLSRSILFDSAAYFSRNAKQQYPFHKIRPSIIIADGTHTQ